MNKKCKVVSQNRVTRRKFLKKAVYSAPALISLGELTLPKTAHADYSGGPDGPPIDFFSPAPPGSSPGSETKEKRLNI